MRSLAIVAVDVFGEDGAQVPLVERERAVEAVGRENSTPDWMALAPGRAAGVLERRSK
jgi:hypothetical protein